MNAPRRLAAATFSKDWKVKQRVFPRLGKTNAARFPFDCAQGRQSLETGRAARGIGALLLQGAMHISGWHQSPWMPPLMAATRAQYFVPVVSPEISTVL